MVMAKTTTGGKECNAQEEQEGRPVSTRAGWNPTTSQAARTVGSCPRIFKFLFPPGNTPLFLADLPGPRKKQRGRKRIPLCNTLPIDQLDTDTW